MTTYYLENVKTRKGIFRIVLSDGGIYALHFPGERVPARTRPVRTAPAAVRKLAARAKRMLERYFAGRKVSFAGLRYDASGWAPFEERVLRSLSRVGWGQSLSYAALARRAGSPRAARAVGNAMRRNRIPVLLPCHRVLRSGGGLGDYGKGPGWKKDLLGLEGKSLGGRSVGDRS